MSRITNSRAAQQTPTLVAIADDTTGALEIGALLAFEGFHCAVNLHADDVATTAAAVVDTNTRHAPPETAFAVVSKALRNVPGSSLLFKKTDSTLRGNIGPELAALCSIRPDHRVIYAPAYPAAGRTALNGVVRISGVPVERTDFSADPHAPVLQSSIPQLLAAAGLSSAMVGGAAAILRALERSKAHVVVCDGETEEDLAETVAAIRNRRDVIVAGPGGIARHWFRSVGREPHRFPECPPVQRWLLVCGSLHPMSRRQVRAAEDLPLRSLTTPDQRLGGGDPIAGLVREACSVIRDGAADGLILFGGETARAVLLELGCRRLSPLRELLPGVPLSLAHAAGGEIPVITKAGGFGDENLVKCILEKMRR